MTTRIDPRFHENYYRPVFEMNSSIINFGGAATTLAIAVHNEISNSNNIGLVSLSLTAYLSYQGVSDLLKAVPLIKRHHDLMFNDLSFIDIEELRRINNADYHIKGIGEKPSDSQDKIAIGSGFEWGVEHANRAEQISGLSSDISEIDLPFYLSFNKKKKREQTIALGGKPWIHGIGEDKDLVAEAQGFYGHTAIMGNVGTGKTTLFILLTMAMIHKGYTVIIIDPKNDNQWKNRIKSEMEHFGFGDKFHYFHPSKPSTSVKIDPIRNWNRPAEIASRIASIMIEEGGSDDAFVRFNWDVINVIVNAMIFVGIRPQIKSIAKYVIHSLKSLVLLCLQTHMKNTFGDDWRTTKSQTLSGYGESETEQLLGYYEQVVRTTHEEPALDNIISMLYHDPVHMQKMVSNLKPILSVLTSPPLDELISPEEDITNEDTRNIVDVESLCEDGGVLYMAVDSLSDSKTAGYLSKLVLADVAAVAGGRYNYSKGEGRRVALFIDEVHAAIAGNDFLINLLAQGRAAWMQMFISTQTKPDLEAKTNQATANRILGLCNNFFSLRANDTSTQEYASKQFGEVPISSQQITVAQSSSSANSVKDFESGYSERLSKQKGNSFSETLLGSMPKLQYVGRLADGRVLKGRIPIIKG